MKRKKRKKKLIINLAIVLTAATAAGTGGYMLYQQKNRDETVIVLEAGQTMVLGQVSSIIGNELTLSLAEEFDSDEQQSSRQGRNTSGGAMGKPDNMSGGAMEMPDNMSGGAMAMPNDMSNANSQSSNQDNSASSSQQGAGGQNLTPPSGMPQGGFGGDSQGGSGDSSDRQNMTPPSGMPQFDQKDDNTESKNEDSKNEDSKNENSEEQVVYQLTGEEESYQIPVGTKVVTQLGKETTFSRIQAEEMLKVVIEENENGEKVIVAIWIVG